MNNLDYGTCLWYEKTSNQCWQIKYNYYTRNICFPFKPFEYICAGFFPVCLILKQKRRYQLELSPLFCLLRNKLYGIHNLFFNQPLSEKPHTGFGWVLFVSHCLSVWFNFNWFRSLWCGNDSSYMYGYVCLGDIVRCYRLILNIIKRRCRCTVIKLFLL